jgi:hypothetical protein
MARIRISTARTSVFAETSTGIPADGGNLQLLKIMISGTDCGTWVFDGYLSITPE